MAPSLVLGHYLKCLDRMLEKIENHAPDGREILNARLYPDMFPLLQQAKVAIGFSLRICCPLAGEDIVSFAGEAMTLSAVREELSRTQQYIEKMPAEAFDGYESRTVKTVAGFAEHEMSGDEYYSRYGLPNFIFHLTTVYAIARSNGVPLSKGDFDGYHEYPAGFSFE